MKSSAHLSSGLCERPAALAPVPCQGYRTSDSISQRGARQHSCLPKEWAQWRQRGESTETFQSSVWTTLTPYTVQKPRWRCQFTPGAAGTPSPPSSQEPRSRASPPSAHVRPRLLLPARSSRPSLRRGKQSVAPGSMRRGSCGSAGR